jgi:hypothetical protein
MFKLVKLLLNIKIKPALKQTKNFSFFNFQKYNQMNSRINLFVEI